MDTKDALALGLGIAPPWKLVGQRLDTDKRPNELHIELAADRGAMFPCPDCGKACKAHDFGEFTWRHLNFFQHHCYITAKVPRTDCPDHGVKRIQVPWAREGSRFTLLFEQAAVILAREMPVLAAARIIGITDQRLWRIIEHYVGQAVARLDLGRLKAVGLDETASKRGHNYVTVFIDLDAKQKPVVFVTPGKGKATVAAFKAFLEQHGGKPGHIVEVVCDMSPAFLAAIGETFEQANVTVDWFHVVQLFTKAVDEGAQGRSQAQHHAQGATLGRAQGRRRQTDDQASGGAGRTRGHRPVHRNGVADQGKAALDTQGRRRPRRPLAHHQLHPPCPSMHRWRSPLGAGQKALETFEKHLGRILQRWTSSHSNARMEGLNGLFQAARAKARGYRNTATYITMIYLIAAPLGNLFDSI